MVSIRSSAALTAIAVILVLASGSAAHAAFPGANGILSWGGTAIRGVDPGSSTERVIVDVPGGVEREPSWSADGQQLVFSHDNEALPGNYNYGIWKANADGSGITQLTEGILDLHPSWSPNGQKIVFSGLAPAGDRALFMMNADGSNRAQLTFSPANEQAPSWSPDGTKIAYEGWTPPESVWMMNPDGSGQESIVAGTNPDWSPFGDELVFNPYPGYNGIARVSLDGSQVTPVIENAGGAAFSPDGTRIAFTRGVDPPHNVDVFTTGYMGGAAVPVGPPASRQFAGWQPIPAPPAPKYVRPKGATPLTVPLVPAYLPCESPDRQHGPPLAFGSCSSPQQQSTTATVGTPDVNGATANSNGSVRYGVIVGNPATPADEADVAVDVDMTDVRHRANNSDYALELQLLVDFNLTERETPTTQTTTSGPDPDGPFFYSWPLRVNVPCTATADPAVGASCHVSTTLDAVLPGAVPERHRAIWGLGQVRVYDSGGDGYASTTDDNELFAVQGLFVP
jgi:TolB protein